MKRKPRVAKPRRDKGTNAIYQRADGRWVGAVDLGKGANGKRRRRVFYGAKKADVLQRITDATARGGGTIKPRAIGTVGQWVEHWLRSVVKPKLSPNTYALYETMWRVHAAPILGGVSLNAFDVEHIEALYTHLRRAGVSNAVQQRVGVVLSRAIVVAIRQRRYMKPNPMQLLDKPAHDAKETRALSIDEARKFIETARDDQYFALWVLLLTGGLRLGEALGLEWRDVDVDGRTLAVRQAVAEVNGIAEVRKPKTRASRRSVNIGDLAVAALHAHQKRSEAGGAMPRFVFETSRGGHPRRSNLRQRHFIPICEKAGIVSLTIHGLRHTMTSLAVAVGVPIHVIADRLGHTTVRMTLDRYSHLLPGQQRQAADALDALLEAPPKR